MLKKFSTKILKIVGLVSYFLLTNTNNYASFLDDQLQFSRVKEAYQLKYEQIASKLDSLNINKSSFEILLKAYKYESELVVYIKEKAHPKWLVYDTLKICASSGYLGPKVMEGDLQVPEGYYHINHFNPYSNFLLSLGVSYPNKADIIKRPAKKKGGAIYVHGNCVTIGCIPITDDVIQELYILSVLATNNGQSKIGIHIFPFNLTKFKLDYACNEIPEHAEFWKNLYSTESHFDSTQTQLKIGISESGDYYLQH